MVDPQPGVQPGDAKVHRDGHGLESIAQSSHAFMRNRVL